MSGKYTELKWQETMNDVTIDCTLDVAVHSADSNIILLTVPGVDGSVDGYKDKYIKIADSVQNQHKVAVVRIANPFITSFHWESNIRRALEYINESAVDITGHKDVEIRIMAHSAGAAIVAQLAWEYPNITRILLINPAMKLGVDKIESGLSQFTGTSTILVGSRDPSLGAVMSLDKDTTKAKIIEIEGADHNFSGPHLQTFLLAADKYLFY